MYRFTLILIISLHSVSCSTLGGWFFQKKLDRSPMRVLSVDLFDQRAEITSEPSWKGDWVLRRERLRIIDESLRALRPQIISFQNLLSKEGSVSDFDRKILARGSLKGYAWSLSRGILYEDTRETSYLALAAIEPLNIDRVERSQELILGTNGLASFTRLYHESQALLVVNVNLEPQNPEPWYELLSQQIQIIAKEFSICRSRIIVTGKLPGDTENLSYLSFLNSLELKDSADGFCELADRCFTIDPQNSFVASRKANILPTRTTKILVPRQTQVIDARRSLTKSQNFSETARKYSLNSLWPVEEFAWQTDIKLARCIENE